MKQSLPLHPFPTTGTPIPEYPAVALAIPCDEFPHLAKPFKLERPLVDQPSPSKRRWRWCRALTLGVVIFVLVTGCCPHARHYLRGHHNHRHHRMNEDARTHVIVDPLDSFTNMVSSDGLELVNGHSSLFGDQSRVRNNGNGSSFMMYRSDGWLISQFAIVAYLFSPNATTEESPFTFYTSDTSGIWLEVAPVIDQLFDDSPAGFGWTSAVYRISPSDDCSTVKVGLNGDTQSNWRPQIGSVSMSVAADDVAEDTREDGTAEDSAFMSLLDTIQT